MAVVSRKIVRIDEDKCDGCELCIPSCAEGAIQIINGKAKLIADKLCDGFGNCLGTCPQDAIIIEERPADEFDEVAVANHLKETGHRPETVEPQRQEHRQAVHEPPRPAAGIPPAGGCPGSMMRELRQAPASAAGETVRGSQPRPSRLQQWPVQLTLLPPMGQIWDQADVLVAADCVPVTVPDFHDSMLAGKTLAIACPKLDDVEPYVQKLAAVFTHNTVRSITVAKMEVPCCMGIVTVVLMALEKAAVAIPVKVVTIGIQGEVIHETIERPRLAG